MFISVDSIIGELFEILFLALLMQGKIRRAALYNWNHPLNIILKELFFSLLRSQFILSFHNLLKPNCI